MHMAYRLHKECQSVYDMIFVFANTGQENEKTLLFVDRCAKEWAMPIVWVEAVVNASRGTGTTHRLITFESASRSGRPFEDVIVKYGIPNKMYPHCTRELKLHPIQSYARSIGWATGTYYTAIGIRADEPNRLHEDSATLIYPLAHIFPMDKMDINEWWESQPFQLGLTDYQGNCTWCWKKSLAKHMVLLQENPVSYDFPARMEKLYGTYPDGSARVFFRESRSVNDLIAISQLLKGQAPPDRPDDDSGCSESCEVF